MAAKRSPKISSDPIGSDIFLPMTDNEIIDLQTKDKIKALLIEQSFTEEQITDFFEFFDTSSFLWGVATLYSEGKVFIDYDKDYHQWRWRAASQEGLKELVALS